MTALKDFERLECQGIWQADAQAQRRNVIVSVGEATLTLSDSQDTAIAHWSLPAVERTNPGERPAQFRPGPDATDILELTDDTMIRAIAKVQKAIQRRRPHPGRLRFGMIGSGAVLIAGLTFFWLPGAMIDYTASVVPATKRAEIGESLLANISRVAGKPCDDALGQQSLTQLQTRLFGGQGQKVVVLSGGVRTAQHLPGNILLLNRAIVEDYEQVDVAAGYLLVENLRAQGNDPLVRLLRDAGLSTAFRLLTTGDIPKETLSSYAETLVVSEPLAVSEQQIVEQFQKSQIRASPYAYALDISGETTVNLIEADAKNPTYEAILNDGEWVSLQGICGG